MEAGRGGPRARAVATPPRPRAPIHRVVRVLQQVRRGLQREPVGEARRAALAQVPRPGRLRPQGDRLREPRRKLLGKGLRPGSRLDHHPAQSTPPAPAWKPVRARKRRAAALAARAFVQAMGSGHLGALEAFGRVGRLHQPQHLRAGACLADGEDGAAAALQIGRHRYAPAFGLRPSPGDPGSSNSMLRPSASARRRGDPGSSRACSGLRPPPVAGETPAPPLERKIDAPARFGHPAAAMRADDLIRKKRDGGTLTPAELRFVGKARPPATSPTTRSPRCSWRSSSAGWTTRELAA